LLCLCHGGTYGFSTESIERIHHIPEKDLLTVEGRPMVRLGDQSLPVIHLSDLLGLPGTTEAIGETPLPVVVLQSAGRRFAVAVDRFLMVRNTVVRRIDGNGMMARTISGAFTLDDGTVGLALSAAELVESATSGDIRPTVKSASRKAPPPAYRVLVVDDSITTRTLEKSILEAHGYHVGISVDGLDALRQLRNGPVDLVVADIQMPKMDGFVLLKELKKDKDLSRIPVILVTSCDDPGDRQRGLELGAEAYIVKQKFDQKELLETIRQLI
jgi:two-component system chemotaxis sensor kinase CheA